MYSIEQYSAMQYSTVQFRTGQKIQRALFDNLADWYGGMQCHSEPLAQEHASRSNHAATLQKGAEMDTGVISRELWWRVHLGVS